MQVQGGLGVPSIMAKWGFLLPHQEGVWGVGTGASPGRGLPSELSWGVWKEGWCVRPLSEAHVLLERGQWGWGVRQVDLQGLGPEGAEARCRVEPSLCLCRPDGVSGTHSRGSLAAPWGLGVPSGCRAGGWQRDSGAREVGVGEQP